MGTTAKGLPYPEPGDPVADGDDAIKALAEAVDDKAGMVSGSVNVTATAAATATAAVVFPVGAFTAAPKVLVTSVNAISGSQTAWYTMANSVTSTGFNAVIAHRDGTATNAQITVHWLAVGV
jgi:H-type lectin domain.